MKRFFYIIPIMIFVLFTAMPVMAAWTISWDAPLVDATHGAATGYTIKFTDGTNTWIKDFPSTGATTEVLDVAALNVPFDVSLTYTITPYNAGGPGAESDPIVWTRPPYTPPDDTVPPPPTQAPGQILQWILDWLN